jgi:hypothetical protein
LAAAGGFAVSAGAVGATGIFSGIWPALAAAGGFAMTGGCIGGTGAAGRSLTNFGRSGIGSVAPGAAVRMAACSQSIKRSF